MYKSILVPVDGSQHAKKALTVAARLLDSSQGEIHALNVCDAASDLLGHSSGARIEIDDATRTAGEQVITACLNVVDTAHAQVHTLVKAGAPADTIVREAERLGVDAIVIGSRGAGNISSLVLGSVAYRVLHAAEPSVILVR